jgi:hypothetical protein
MENRELYPLRRMIDIFGTGEGRDEEGFQLILVSQKKLIF